VQSAAGTHCVGGWLVYKPFLNFADKVKITSANKSKKTMFRIWSKISVIISSFRLLCSVVYRTDTDTDTVGILTWSASTLRNQAPAINDKYTAQDLYSLESKNIM
jgi:hypothetical protein